MKLNERKFITFLLAPFLVSVGLAFSSYGGPFVFFVGFPVILGGHLFLSKSFKLANRWLKIDPSNSIDFSDNIFQLPIISAGLLVFLLAFLKIPDELFLLGWDNFNIFFQYPMIVFWVAALVMLALYLKKLSKIFKEVQIAKKLRILKIIITGVATLLLFTLIFLYYYFAITIVLIEFFASAL